MVNTFPHTDIKSVLNLWMNHLKSPLKIDGKPN